MVNMKKMMIPVIAVVVVGLVIGFFINQTKFNGATLESRTLRLRKISNLDESVTIGQEVMIDGYIISGYTAPNDRHGLAVFLPQGNGTYQFQTNVTRQNDELVFLTVMVRDKLYDVFWANQADLDYAEITYTIDGQTGESVRLDAQNNQIVYLQAPAKNYSVEYYFVNVNGKRYG